MHAPPIVASTNRKARRLAGVRQGGPKDPEAQATPVPEPAGECWHGRALCGVSLDGRLFGHRQVKSLGAHLVSGAMKKVWRLTRKGWRSDYGVSGGGSGTPKPLARDLVHAPEKDRSRDSA